MMSDTQEAEILLNETLDVLCERADLIRKVTCGEEVHLRGVIEYSNVCSRNCVYCGIRRDNLSVKRYKMSVDEIVAVAVASEKQGVKTMVIQSGENDAEDPGFIENVIRKIKQNCDVAVTICVGEKDRAIYSNWFESGADRYLLKFETSSSTIYNKCHENTDMDARIRKVRELKNIGYQIGTGGIVGLPGQKISDLARDILLTRDLDVDMAAFGPLVPSAHTPLDGVRHGDIDLSIKVIAAVRILLGNTHIPATTALDAVVPDGRERALRAGANVVMVNLTPMKYRSLYDIYPSNRAANSIDNIKTRLEKIGRPIAKSYGHSYKISNGVEPCNALPKV